MIRLLSLYNFPNFALRMRASFHVKLMSQILYGLGIISCPLCSLKKARGQLSPLLASLKVFGDIYPESQHIFRPDDSELTRPNSGSVNTQIGPRPRATNGSETFLEKAPPKYMTVYLRVC